MADLICIRTFRNSMEAEVAKGLLETKGIFATTASSAGNVIGTGGVGVGSVRLLVRDADVQEALNLLGEPAREARTMSELSALIVDELTRGQSREDVVELLVRRGWPQVSAQHFVDNKAQQLVGLQKSSSESAAAARMYRRKMVRGLLWAIAGITLTVAMYRTARGSTHVIWWGVVLFGFVDFVTGLIGWLNHR